MLEKDLCTYCRKPFTGDAKMVLDDIKINCHASCFKVSRFWLSVMSRFSVIKNDLTMKIPHVGNRSLHAANLLTPKLMPLNGIQPSFILIFTPVSYWDMSKYFHTSGKFSLVPPNFHPTTNLISWSH